MTMDLRATRCAGRWAVLAAIVLAVSTARAQDQTPRFRSGVDVTSVDVTVLDERGHPILGLKPEDFTVRLDGAMSAAAVSGGAAVRPGRHALMVTDASSGYTMPLQVQVPAGTIVRKRVTF